MEIENKDLSTSDYQGMLSDFLGRGGAFKDLKDMSDDSMEAIYSVAYNLYEGGKYDEAIKVFEFLCFYDHRCTKYFLGLGSCLLMQKSYEKAIEIFGYLSVLDTSDPQGILHIGDCYLALGNTENAIRAFEGAVAWAGEQDKWQAQMQRAQAILDMLKGETEAEG